MRCYVAFVAIVVSLSVVHADNLKCVQCGPVDSIKESLKELFSAVKGIFSGDKKLDDLKVKFSAGCPAELPQATPCSSSSHKYCVKWTFENDGEMQAIRGCSDVKEADECKEDTKLCTYSCDTDGCNGAKHAAGDVIVAVAAAATSLLLVKFY